jgi:predicted DNA-binding transcriptional regulator YafY
VRADRLIALALLLQARGRLTAPDLAERLEVSVRTIYRDLDALSAAGVPVYAECGRGGGISLPDGYRLDLTALNKEEARALFLGGFGAAGMAGPDGVSKSQHPLADLGVGAVLDGALRKLTAALPAASRDEAERARQRLLVDTDDWWANLQDGQRADGAPAPRTVPPHLRTIEDAVWRDRRLRIRYPRRVREEGSVVAVDGPPTERVLDPYALVAKRGAWYLVAAPATHEVHGSTSTLHQDESDGPPGTRNTQHAAQATRSSPRVYRVSRIRDAEMLAEASHRPADFDLMQFWAQWCADFVTSLPRYDVTLRVAPSLAPRLARNPVKGAAFPARILETDAEGWVAMELDLEAPEVAYPHLLGYGPDVEVLAPPTLRARIATAAAATAKRYTLAPRGPRKNRTKTENPE